MALHRRRACLVGSVSPAPATRPLPARRAFLIRLPSSLGVKDRAHYVLGGPLPNQRPALFGTGPTRRPRTHYRRRALQRVRLPPALSGASPPAQQLTVNPGLTESLPRKRVVTLGTGLRLAIAVRHRAPQNQLPVSPALATIRTLHKYPNLYDLIMFNFPLA